MIPPLGATIDGTKRYFRRIQKKWMHEDKVRSFCELTIPAMAMGTYMGHSDDETDALYFKTIETGLELGLNFVDTAINYRSQRSEKVIGKVLQKLIQSKKISRDEIVVASKGGFIPFLGAPAPSLKNYIQQHYIEPGILTADDIVANCHSISPRFIQNQISTSLENLHLETLDIYYLHNPETQLPHIGADVFYDKIEKAFEVLEDNVERGKIQYYGMATWNGLRALPHEPESLDLHRIYKAAQRAGGHNHHFKVLQLPFNLNMREMLSLPNQKVENRLLTLSQMAQDLDLKLMASSPLLQAQVLQKGDGFYKKIPGSFSQSQKALQYVMSQPSITATMTGMKSLSHLKENMGVLEKESWNVNQLKELASLP